MVNRNGKHFELNPLRFLFSSSKPKSTLYKLKTAKKILVSLTKISTSPIEQRKVLLKNGLPPHYGKGKRRKYCAETVMTIS